MRTEYISPEVVEKIRANMPPNQWLALWVSCETGLRVGDVVALRRDNIKGRTLRYRAQKTGKSGKCKLSKQLAAALTASSSQGWVFPSPKNSGKHLTRQAVWHRVKRACQLAGIDSRGIAPHSFRKYFAVELFAEVGLDAVQKALQHDSVRTTEIYALSDFTDSANADKPLLRRDIRIVADIVAALLKGS